MLQIGVKILLRMYVHMQMDYVRMLIVCVCVYACMCIASYLGLEFMQKPGYKTSMCMYICMYVCAVCTQVHVFGNEYSQSLEVIFCLSVSTEQVTH